MGYRSIIDYRQNKGVKEMSAVAELNSKLRITYEVCIWKPSGDGFQVIYSNDHTHFIPAQEAITDLLDESDSLDRICESSDLEWARAKTHYSLVWKVGAVLWRNRRK